MANSNRHSGMRVLGGALLMLAALGIAAVTGAENEGNYLRIEAGSTRGSLLQDSTGVKILSGGVIAWHEGIILTAEEGVYESGPGFIRFLGGAVLRDSARTVEADTLEYNEKTGWAVALGNVRVTEGDRRVHADTLRYLHRRQLIEAFGNVVVADDSLNGTLTGSKAEFDDTSGRGYVVGNPSLMRADEEGVIVTIACSDTIQVFRNEGITRLWNNVVMTRDSLEVHAGLALYDKNTETATFFREPVVTYQMVEHREESLTSSLLNTSRVVGDTIRVYLAGRELRGVDIIGGAVATIGTVDSVGTLFDRSVIESNDMVMNMGEEGIERILAEGAADSYYYRRKVENERQFVNLAAGDTLVFGFENGHIVSIKIGGYGGSPGRGRYYGYEPTVAEPDSAVPPLKPTS